MDAKDLRDQRDGRDAVGATGGSPALDLSVTFAHGGEIFFTGPVKGEPGKDLRLRSEGQIAAIILELGECPHCHNSEPWINDAPGSEGDGDGAVIYQVECIMCGMCSPWMDTPEEAAAIWERIEIRKPEEVATNGTNGTKVEG